MDNEKQKKRQYNKKKNKEPKSDLASSNVNPVQNVPKKRGRKKKVHELIMKPEDVINFIDKKYPYTGLSFIKDDIIRSLKVREQFGEQPYLVDQIFHDGKVYWKDEYNNILNSDAQNVGHIIKKGDVKKIYLYQTSKYDTYRDPKKLFNDIMKDILQDNRPKIVNRNVR